MLIDQMREQKITRTFPDGYRYEDALKPVIGRIGQAQHYLLSESAIAMVASVAYSKPSSLLAALPWVRLPFESIFIEFANDHLSKALALAGSPNLWHPDTKIRLIRSGFLLKADEDGLKFDYVAAQEPEGGAVVIDLSPVQCRYRLSADTPSALPTILPLNADPQGRRGKSRETFKLVTSDPKEFAAEMDLRNRFEWEPHPDMLRMFESFSRMNPSASVEDVWQRQADEAYRLFMQAVLPALILLNCRNAIEVEHVPAPDKLNKARIKRGKHPIAERREIRMKLSRSRQGAEIGQGSSSPRASSTSFVTGHFKVRSGGRIFWWSPHIRHGTLTDTPTPKTRILTA